MEHQALGVEKVTDVGLPENAGQNATTEEEMPKEGTKGKQNKPRLPARKKDPSLRLAEVGMHGTGFVKAVKDTFGFINTPELDEQLYFHEGEFIRSAGSEEKPFSECIAPGDEVEFVVGQNTGQRMNLVAQKVKKLPPNSVKAQILSDDCYQGRVTKELNSGSWRSEGSSIGQIRFQCQGEGNLTEERDIDFHTEDVYKVRQLLKKGAIVRFYVCTDNQSKAQKAVHVEVVMDASSASSQPTEKVLHGFLKEIGKTGGVIRCIEVERRFSFKIAEVTHEPHTVFAKGSSVVFTIVVDPKGKERVASLMLLPQGSLSATRSLGTYRGKVVRSVSREKGAESGLILTSQLPTARPIFDSESSADPKLLDVHSLEIDDEVEFELQDNLRLDTRFARKVRLMCKGKEKRELGQVRTKKSNFGFVVCCQRSGQLFFHSSFLVDCKFEDLKKGDDVEFAVERHPERGTMAVRVKKVPQGSAVFETVSEARYKGYVTTPPTVVSQGVTSSGVLEFEEDGQQNKLLFSANDFKDEVRIGEYVSFQIADNAKAAKQVESLGSTVSKMIGRRAIRGELIRYTGTVRQALQGFGYIKYREPGSDSDKRVTFVLNQELKPGDEVSFVLTKGPKLQEETAQRLVRTKEAPVVIPEAVPNPSPKLPTSSAPVVRTPAMPDGTRGFHMGRGGKLPTPPSQNGATVPPGIGAEPRVPGKLLTNGNHAKLGGPPVVSNGQHVRTGHLDGQPNLARSSPQPNKAGDPIDRRRKKKEKEKAKVTHTDQSRQLNQSPQPLQNTVHPTALLKATVQRTASGHALNPHAMEFQPRSSGVLPSKQEGPQ